MTTKVTITFEVTQEQYYNYNRDINDFLDNLYETGIQDVDVREDNGSNPVHVDKTTIAEIDSELFFNHVSMDTKSWSYDYSDLEENKPVFEYIKKYYPNELKALKDGTIDYLEVYCDY